MSVKYEHRYKTDHLTPNLRYLLKFYAYTFLVNPQILLKSLLIKEIISTEFARVAEYSISPETNGIQHYHNEVDEELYCLSGSLRIRVLGRVDKALKTGDKIEIPVGVTHSVHNDAGNSSRYLVIQGNGEYDFIES